MLRCNRFHFKGRLIFNELLSRPFCLLATSASAETCAASQYGVRDGYHGKRAADGSIFNTYAMTAAHKTRPFGTHATVTNLSNGRSVSVRVTDRGPFVRARCIDLSRAAANAAIGMGGTASVSRMIDPSRLASAVIVLLLIGLIAWLVSGMR